MRVNKEVVYKLGRCKLIRIDFCYSNKRNAELSVSTVFHIQMGDRCSMNSINEKFIQNFSRRS
jgi:hypothetical protein